MKLNKIQRATWRTDGDRGPECSSQMKRKQKGCPKIWGTGRMSNAEGIVTNELFSKKRNLKQVQTEWGGFHFLFIICSTGSMGSQRVRHDQATELYWTEQQVLEENLKGWHHFSNLKCSSSMEVFVFKNTNTVEYSWWRVFDGKGASRKKSSGCYTVTFCRTFSLFSFFIRLELG